MGFTIYKIISVLFTLILPAIMKLIVIKKSGASIEQIKENAIAIIGVAIDVFHNKFFIIMYLILWMCHIVSILNTAEFILSLFKLELLSVSGFVIGCVIYLLILSLVNLLTNTVLHNFKLV